MRTFKHKESNVEARYTKCNYHLYVNDRFIGVTSTENVEGSLDWIELIEKDYEILEWGYEKENGDYKYKGISKVKRLSDGEVFSVDDINPDGTKIKGFEVFDTGIHVDIGLCCVPLSNMRKRKPILTSEDGVDLFEGDKCVAYDAEDNVIVSKIIDEDDPIGGWIYFSTREAAEDYRLNNYRGLSLNDIRETIYTTDMGEAIAADLEKVVKSRLS